MRTTIATVLIPLLSGCSRSAPAAAPVPARPAATAVARAPTIPDAASVLVVDSPARTALLAAGDPAPVFHAIAHDGRAIDVTSQPRSRALIVYFYPRDETPGCTIEANAFRDSHPAYEQAAADVVGVSTDSNESHRAFAEHFSLPFSLIADTQGRLAAAFGVELRNGAARRTTFVINRQGRVAQVFPAVQVNGHSDEVIAAVRAAQ